MKEHPRKQYASPELTKFGDVGALTAFSGDSSRRDFDSRNDTFGRGSFDICNNDDENNVC